MSKAAEKNPEQPPNNGEATPSMEEILQSIRGVISGDEKEEEADDVLELTDMVEEPNTAVNTPENKENTSTSLPKETEATALQKEETAAGSDKSILDDIDKALEVPEAEAKPVEEPKSEEKPQLESIKEEKMKENEAAGTASQDTLEADANKEKEAPAEEINAEPIESPTQEEKDDTEEESDDSNKKNKKRKANGLITEKVAEASSTTIKELVNNIPDKHVNSPQTRSGTSLEELVIEAMKPFLAEWLNNNLPIIVKKIVEKEVKRIIPKEDED